MIYELEINFELTALRSSNGSLKISSKLSSIEWFSSGLAGFSSAGFSGVTSGIVFWEALLSGDLSWSFSETESDTTDEVSDSEARFDVSVLSDCVFLFVSRLNPKDEKTKLWA